VIRLADYVFKYLADYGVKHVFVITGGGAMHLNDALGKQSRIEYICNHHEQASAMAAEAYARVKNSLGVLSVTTGPGGINALNGVFGAWTDSIPVLVISGQVKCSTNLRLHGNPGLRQLGDQEADIISMVQGITKYSKLVTKANKIKYYLDEAIYLATTGRKGPVWLDIPMDVQAAMIDEANLESFVPDEELESEDLENNCQKIIEMLKDSKYPVALLGSGIRLASAKNELEIFKKLVKIPMTVSWTGTDLLPNEDDLFCGRAGSLGDRAGNFAVQNADLLLVLGSRLSIRQVSYNWDNFADRAKIVHVDIDSAELNKYTLDTDLKIQADLKKFFIAYNSLAESQGFAYENSAWLAWCKEKVSRYPVLRADQVSSKLINPYYFVDKIFRLFNEGELIVCGDGTACVVTNQAAFIKLNQHMFTNSGCASMGFDLPAAIGASFARPGQRIICFSGDGSIQMNIQELQTIIHHQLPIKIFVFNNQGYLSIKLTQKSYFNSEFMGSSLDSGISFPDLIKLAKVYGFKTYKLDKPNFEDQLVEILDAEGPVFCELVVDPEQGFEPKLSSRVLSDGSMQSARLEDMAPFLDEEELRSNLVDWFDK
jgi:acetolactate synthase I/II/III large subunit